MTGSVAKHDTNVGSDSAIGIVEENSLEVDVEE